MGLLLGMLFPSPSAQQATVEFFISDGWGQELKTDVVIEIIPDGGASSPYWINYPRRRTATLTTGNYTVLVDATGFRRKAQRLRVLKDSLFIPISLTVAPIEDAEGNRPSRLLGTLGNGLKSAPPMWVRVIGLYNGVNLTERIDETGSFVIDQLPPGRYLLLIFSKGVLKESRPVDMRAYDTKLLLE